MVILIACVGVGVIVLCIAAYIGESEGTIEHVSRSSQKQSSEKEYKDTIAFHHAEDARMDADFERFQKEGERIMNDPDKTDEKKAREYQQLYILQQAKNELYYL